jgi:hypothetical protein
MVIEFGEFSEETVNTAVNNILVSFLESMYLNELVPKCGCL